MAPRRRPLPAHGPRAEGGRLVRRPDEAVDTPGLRRREEIAAPVEPEDIAALPSELFEEIDAPVHDGNHVVARARPPVPVALGGFVAGQRERGPPAPQPHAPPAAPPRRVIRGGDSGDARATD